MEAHADDRETGRLHQLHALGAELLTLEKELRIAAAAGQVADKMQTVHSSTPQNAKAQPAVKKSGLRLPFAPCGAKQRCAIALNSCKTSYSLANSPRISADTASIKRRAIEILLGSLGNCNTSNQFASSISAGCGRTSPLAHSQTKAIISECGNGHGWPRKTRVLLICTPTSSAISRAKHCSSDAPGSTKPARALYMPGGKCG